MQFKIVRHRDKEGAYREGNTVQCLRRTREITSDFPEGKNVQRVVAKFDRAARELPADASSILTPAERAEWQDWRAKQDEEHLKSVAQFELDTLAESVRVARIGAAKGYATTTSENAVTIRKEVRALIRVLTDLGLMPEPVRGRPEKDDESEIEWLPNFAKPGTPQFDSYQRLLEEHERRKAQNQGGRDALLGIRPRHLHLREVEQASRFARGRSSCAERQHRRAGHLRGPTTQALA